MLLEDFEGSFQVIVKIIKYKMQILMHFTAPIIEALFSAEYYAAHLL